MNFPTLRLFDGYQHTSPNLKPHVMHLQEELKREGYQLESDGYFGPGTEELVKRFQAAKGILADGIVGPVTWNALFFDELVTDEDVFTTTYDSENRDMAKHHDEALKYQPAIMQCSSQFEISAPVICAIGSRESGWGLFLKPSGPIGTGDYIKRGYPTKFRDEALPSDGGGFGRGVMQIDFDAHEFARNGDWRNPVENIKYGCGVFSDCRHYVKKKTDLTGLSLIRASLAAYNCGPARVVTALKNNLDIDYYTAGRDYSKDVLNRAGFFQLMGW